MGGLKMPDYRVITAIKHGAKEMKVKPAIYKNLDEETKSMLRYAGVKIILDNYVKRYEFKF